MTDRELLEFAAKAAGYALGDGWGELRDGIIVNGTGHGDGDIWNPLNDNGDALRLAVKLQLAIAIDSDRSWSHHVNVMMGSEVMHNGDQEAATRRAIVRAAAELGKVL